VTETTEVDFSSNWTTPLQLKWAQKKHGTVKSHSRDHRTNGTHLQAQIISYRCR